MSTELPRFLEQVRSYFTPIPPLVNVHRLSSNIGDRMSSPVLYIDFCRNAPQFDLFQTAHRAVSKCRLVIVGGGGLLDNEFFASGWEALLTHSRAKLVGWGIGHNRHGGSGYRYPGFLERFSLLGLRDYDVSSDKFDWVPCASCLHEGFQKRYELEHRYVCYEHEHVALPIGGIPKMKNNEPSFEKVLRFLGSSEVVLTNSYHGMYWATLLNKKVLVFPFSSKFFGFRYPAVHATAEAWKSLLGEAKSYPDALGECREANIRFAEKVESLWSSLS